MSHIHDERMLVAGEVSSAAAGRGPTAAARTPVHASIAALHRRAGNRAVAGLLAPQAGAVQRDVGWKDASTQGRAWNVDERGVGKIRRIPLEGLSEGLQDETAQTWVWDDPEKKKGHFATESTTIEALSSESAKGKAIVLVPDALDATQKVEVLVFLHGFTEGTHRPYAGGRALTDPAPSLAGQGKSAAERLKRLRQGADPSELPGPADTAPVRDVALDQAEQQLEQSGQRQLVIVLPQGGLHSQFGKGGDTNFDSAKYVGQIVSRLLAEQRWKDGTGKVATTAPDVSRIDMGGHSGAGATLAHMADQSVAEAATAAAAAKSGKAPKAPAKPPASSGITGDLLIYDAINGDQLSSFKNWAKLRLNEDLAVLTDRTRTDAAKLAYLQTAQKLRGYCTDSYKGKYIQLDEAIATWFAAHKKELGPFADCLRANYALEYIDVNHEELMRGSEAGTKRPAGAGAILDAIRALHPPLQTSTGACPPPPKPLADRIKESKQASAARAKEAEAAKAKAKATTTKTPPTRKDR